MKPRRRAFLTLLAVAALPLAANAQTPQLRVRGQLQYVHGINAAWFFGRYSSDIGLNPLNPSWGTGYNSATVENVMTDLQRMKVNVVRVWLFEALEGLTFDSSGYVSGLQSGFLTNLDDLVARANSKGLALELVFLNHTLKDQWGQTPPGAGAVRNFVNDATARTRFVDNAVRPLIQRYWNDTSRRNAIFGYDVINEANIGADNGSYTWDNMRAIGSAVATAAHGVNSSIQVTMSTQWWAFDNQSWHSGRFGGLGLDYYSYHEYSDSPNLPAKPSWLEKPLLLGEYGPSTWTESQQNSSSDAYIRQARDRGYAGSMGWMYWNSTGNGENITRAEGGNANWEPTGFTIQSYGNQFFGGTTSPVVAYADAIGSDWQDWSWSATNDWNATFSGMTGSKCLSTTLAGWGAVSLRAGTAVSTSGRTKVTFRVNGGSAGRTLSVSTQTGDSAGNSPSVSVTAAANSWTTVTVTLAQLGNPASIKRINIQNSTGGTVGTFYLDQIQIE